MAWTSTLGEFIVESFLINGKSVSATSRNFRNHFQLSKHHPVSDQKIVLLWIKNFRAVGLALKRKSFERTKSIRAPEKTKFFWSPFCNLQNVQVVTIPLHRIFLFAM